MQLACPTAAWAARGTRQASVALGAGEGLFKIMGLVDMPVAHDSGLLRDGCLMEGTGAAAENETAVQHTPVRFPRWPGDDWGAAAKRRRLEEYRRRKALGLVR